MKSSCIVCKQSIYFIHYTIRSQWFINCWKACQHFALEAPILDANKPLNSMLGGGRGKGGGRQQKGAMLTHQHEKAVSDCHHVYCDAMCFEPCINPCINPCVKPHPASLPSNLLSFGKVVLARVWIACFYYTYILVLFQFIPLSFRNYFGKCNIPFVIIL